MTTLLKLAPSTDPCCRVSPLQPLWWARGSQWWCRRRISGKCRTWPGVSSSCAGGRPLNWRGHSRRRCLLTLHHHCTGDCHLPFPHLAGRNCFRCWGLAGCGTWPTAWRRGTGGFRGWSGRTAGVSRCPRPILPRWQWSYWRRRRYSSSGGEWPGHKLLVTVLLPCHCSIQLVRSVHYDLSIMSWIASPKGNLL